MREVRLIDANALRKDFLDNREVGQTTYSISEAIEKIDNAPTVEQDTLITEIIEELESRKDYGTEYAQAMEDVIVILKAKFGIDSEEIENTEENNRFCKTCKHFSLNEDDLSERCYDCLLPNVENKEVRENRKLWKYPNWEAENENY